MNKVILALGSDVKNRILFANGKSLYFGPDTGDLSKTKNFESFKREVFKVTKRIKPDIVTFDLHPNYFSSLFAKNFRLSIPNEISSQVYHSRKNHSRKIFFGTPKSFFEEIRRSGQDPDASLRRNTTFGTCYSLLPVQHHHAHIASVIQEHNLKEPVIGISFDGAGYGQDGNFWGGEFLLVDMSGFKRLAHLKYRMMPGGDKVVYEPWRMVLSILGRKAIPFLTGIRKKDCEFILAMTKKNINSPKTSSAGRLFDAAAALLGVCVYASYEAEGPMKMEAMCDKKEDEYYISDIFRDKDCFIIDTSELFLGMFKDLKKGKDKRLIATKFHNSIVEIIVVMTKKLYETFKIKDTALSGGVFQNRFLKDKVIEKLVHSGFNVFTNIKAPVNDLNISLGQYYVARYFTDKNKVTSNKIRKSQIPNYNTE